MRNLIACSLAAALAASAGCYSDDVVAQPAYAAEPELETITPGVEVVDDLDYPVFYSDNYYWLWDGGYWFRSPSWRGGWVGVSPYGVPWGVRGIRTPLAYSHWHGGYAHGHVAYRGPVYHGARPSYTPHMIANRGGFHGGGHGGGGHGGHH
ncbi:MAG TPA: hypothetical protein VGL61_23510 [Kofleriaceae bacterium]|jgi:hypothetical protein